MYLFAMKPLHWNKFFRYMCYMKMKLCQTDAGIITIRFVCVNFENRICTKVVIKNIWTHVKIRLRVALKRRNHCPVEFPVLVTDCIPLNHCHTIFSRWVGTTTNAINKEFNGRRWKQSRSCDFKTGPQAMEGREKQTIKWGEKTERKKSEWKKKSRRKNESWTPDLKL